MDAPVDVVVTAPPPAVAKGQGRLLWIGVLWMVLVALLVALHSPGQISVDSGIALFEGIRGYAVGWGPPFFAAVLAWLGGGIVGASVFVALNTLAVFGALFLVLSRGGDARHLAGLPWYRLLPALLLCLNPMFLFYVGIVWKDVMLATLAMVSVAGLFALERRMSGRRAWIAVLLLLPLAAMPYVRQQGLLVALPLWWVLAWLVARHWRSSRPGRAAVALVVLLLLAGTHQLLGWLSVQTVTPVADSPTSTGIATVMAYDVIGTTARSGNGEPARRAGASDEVIAEMVRTYSPERIDTSWHNPAIRPFIRELGPRKLRHAWVRGVREQPAAYLSHRRDALGALLGFGSMRGCVAGYWGVAVPHEYLQWLGVAEEMDPRDRMIGHATIALSKTPVLRHWPYLLLLLAVTATLWRRRRGDGALTASAAVIGAWLYFGSYVPTTIACDFRYLFPTAALASLVAVHLLVRRSPEHA